MPEYLHKVLIADPDEAQAARLKKLVNNPKEGLRLVGAVRTGPELLEAYYELKPDVIITETNLPLLSGLEACREIRKENHQVILLFHTAYADFNYAQEAISLRADGYILKNAKTHDLLEVIRACVLERKFDRIAKAARKAPDADFLHYTFFYKLYDSLACSNLRGLVENIKNVITFVEKQRGNPIPRMDLVNLIITINYLIKLNPYLAGVYKDLEGQEFYDDFYGEADEKETRELTLRYLNRLLQVIDADRQKSVDLPQLIDRYLQKYYQSRIGLNDIAKKFHLSPSYISKIYSEARGVSIIDALKDLRLTHAAHLFE